VSFNTTAGSSPSTQTVQVINSGAGSIGGLAFAVTYGAGATGWLSTSSLSGTTTPSTLTVRPLTTGLAAGTYTANIAVSGTGVASRTLTVTLVVAINGLAVTIAAWPALASVGGIAGSVGTLNFSAVAVVRTGQNSFIAFSLLCPHAGSTVQVQSGAGGQAFRCPNHGATWNASGVLLPSSPQATSRLSPLTVTYSPGDSVLYVS
jgi:Rieske Fe-S protein